MKRLVMSWLILLNLLAAGCLSSDGNIYSGEDISGNRGFSHFELIDSENNSFNSSTIQGQVVIVNFFLTNCNNACPLITNDLKIIEQSFFPAHNENLTILSITVDPWRDGPEDLVDYMNYFNVSWTHLTTAEFIDGDFSKMEQIWADFGITVVLTESENSTSIEGRGHTVYYDVEHTNGIVIIGKDGLQKVRWTEDNWDLISVKSDLALILQE